MDTALRHAVDTSVVHILLVEDNPADADLVRERLALGGRDAYEIEHVARLSDAEALMERPWADVILLDLSLPDASGSESVRRLRGCNIPIVVLTGMNDDRVGLECIEAGAEDYLSKDGIDTRGLRRSIGYAIARRREAQLNELSETLREYRRMSSEASTTSVTATLAGTGPLRDKNPDAFGVLVKDYVQLFGAYLVQLVVDVDKPRVQMEATATRLGDLGGGPRDLLDVHLAALDALVEGRGAGRVRAVTLEGRLFALEMMGLLVDYYRTGGRRLLSMSSEDIA